MPVPDESFTVGELARQVRDAFVRLEGLARRLEDGHFVRTDLYVLFKETVSQALAAIERNIAGLDAEKANKKEVDTLVGIVDHKLDKASLNPLEARVAQLEDDKKWLMRLIMGFIVLGVLGAVFVVAGGQKS